MLTTGAGENTCAQRTEWTSRPNNCEKLQVLLHALSAGDSRGGDCPSTVVLIHVIMF